MTRPVRGESPVERPVFRCGSPLAASAPFPLLFAVVALAIGAGLGARGAAFGWAIAACALVVVGVVVVDDLWPTRVELAPEGLAMWRVRRRFVPYASMRAVEAFERDVVGDGSESPIRRWRVITFVRVTLRDGRTFDVVTGEHLIPVDGSRATGALHPWNVGDTATRTLVRDLRARVREVEEGAADRSPLAADLARRDRPLDDWARDLRALASQGAGAFRSFAPTLEALFAVVEDPVAPEDVRAAAAVVLRVRAEPEVVARLRVVAEGCASPRLRVALERTVAAADDEEEARSALSALEE